MSVNGVGTTSNLMVQSVVDMRARLADLQRQLGSGQKSTTYAGIGLDRGLAVGLRSQLAAIGSYRDTITMIGTRIEVAQTALTRMDELSSEVKRSAQLAPFDLDNTGQTTGQKNARLELSEMLGLLNSQAGDRYLFSGRAGDQPSVETLEHISTAMACAPGSSKCWPSAGWPIWATGSAGSTFRHRLATSSPCRRKFPGRSVSSSRALSRP